MHSILELGANVPAFLAKLWRLVDDPDTNDLICWSEDGTSFYIRDQAQFSRKLLPMYYKHNNMASFIRQLNMYGFHKIVAADAGSLRLDRDEMEFAHQCFLRGHPYLLEHIKRKNQLLSNKQLDESRVAAGGGSVVRADIMNKLLNEVKHMRGRQETVETRLSNMKQENEALWRELSLLRQKHMKQQTIVNKLIQFLVTLVHPSQRLNPKKRYPLMINNVAHPTTDTKNGSKGRTALNSNGSQGRRLFTVVLPSNQTQSTSGTTIHEVDNDMIIGDAEDLLDPSITLEDPEEELSNLPETDDLSSSVILGELTDNLTSDNSITLIPTDESVTQNALTQTQVLRSNATSSENVFIATGQEEQAIEILPSDILMAVDPLDVNPAIIVPGLQKRKAAQKAVNQVQQAPSAVSTVAMPLTRLQSSRSSDANKGNGTASIASKSSAAAAAAAVEKAVAAIKKEPRITSNRSRKRKAAPAKCAVQGNIAQGLQQTMDPVDLLAEVGLVSPAPVQMPAVPEPMAPMGVPVSSPNGCAPPLSPVVVFPMSEPSECGSPAAPPTSPYMTELPCRNSNVMEGSPMSGSGQGSSSQVPSPLVVYPAASPAKSPMSPHERAYSTDLALACTSQDNSVSAATSQIGTPADSMNREELDVHCESLDSELGQLKDLLHNSNFSLDASTLLGLFNPEDTLPFSVQQGNDGKDPLSEDPLGNELTMYGEPDMRDVLDFAYLDRRTDSTSPPPLGDGCDINTPVLTPASPGFNSNLADAKRRKV